MNGLLFIPYRDLIPCIICIAPAAGRNESWKTVSGIILFPGMACRKNRIFPADLTGIAQCLLKLFRT